MDISDLNVEQRQAVLHDKGPMLVVAGAGTGKTNVITRRIAQLIKSGRSKPEEILALTFTEKAAGEMLDRLDGLIGWQAYQVPVMTFHAFGANVLSRFAHHAGWPVRMEVLSETAKLVLMQRHFHEVDLHYYSNANNQLDFLSSILGFIGLLQNADIAVADFESYVGGLKPGDTMHQLDILELKDKAQLYRLYDDIKRRYGLIDFNDQMQLPLQLLQQKPNITERLRREYTYVLVDEYQDTNRVQDKLLRLLVPPDGNIFAVGDDDQAIYGFRGAKIDNILSFSEHFNVKNTLVLTQNYRSSQEILDSAYKLISHNNPDRLEARLGLDKQLKGQFHGPAIEFIGALGTLDEHNQVVRLVKAELSEGRSTNQIAILATSHAALRSLARLLRNHHLSYQLSSNLNIFEQQEIVQLWFLLGWLILSGDDAAITQLLLGPYINWQPAQVRIVSEMSANQLISLEAAIEQMASGGDEPAAELVRTIALWRSWAKQLPVSQLVYQLIFETGIIDSWKEKAQTSARMLRVFEDLQLWLKQMQQFESVAMDTSISGYLATFPKPPEIESEVVSGDEGGVRLLTIHASKGLEFETVIIINNSMEAWVERASGLRETLPVDLTRNQDALPPEHEKRRLLYVAMTRASKKLILTAPTKQKGGRSRKLSPYLREIFDEKQITTDDSSQNESMIDKTLQELQRYAPFVDTNKDQPLPFERSDGWMELSTTQLQAYEYCPYEFYVAHVLGISLQLGPQLGFGTLLHQLFQMYYELKTHKEPTSLDFLQQQLLGGWSSRGYRSAKQSDTALATAQQALSYFYNREESEQRILRSTEEAFAIQIAAAKLIVRGRIDVSFLVPGGIEVRDYKTGRIHDSEKLCRDAKTNLQLRTYALAIQEATGQPPVRVVLDYVVTATEGAAELTPLILQRHGEKLAVIAAKIRSREFAPRKDPFHSCTVGRYWGSNEENDEEEAAS